MEQPSQWMENWLEQPSVLRTMAVHWQTGEPIPDALVRKIKAANTFRAASAMVRQLKLALTDLELHSGFKPGDAGDGRTFWDVEREVEEKARILPPLEEDRFLCSFRHIWAGGYSAGYYSCAAPPRASLACACLRSLRPPATARATRHAPRKLSRPLAHVPSAHGLAPPPAARSAGTSGRRCSQPTASARSRRQASTTTRRCVHSAASTRRRCWAWAEADRRPRSSWRSAGASRRWTRCSGTTTCCHLASSQRQQLRRRRLEP